jgi:hypothetical protein
MLPDTAIKLPYEANSFLHDWRRVLAISQANAAHHLDPAIIQAINMEESSLRMTTFKTGLIIALYRCCVHL